MFFDRDQAVLLAQQFRRDQGRARIAARARAAHEIEIELQGLGPAGEVDDLGDAGSRLAAALRLVARQIVEPAPRMGIDHGEGRRLLLQARQDRDQRQMLDHIGKVPGVEGVAVIHGRPMMNKTANRAILKTGEGVMFRSKAQIAAATVLVIGWGRHAGDILAGASLLRLDRAAS